MGRGTRVSMALLVGKLEAISRLWPILHFAVAVDK